QPRDERLHVAPADRRQTLGTQPRDGVALQVAAVVGPGALTEATALALVGVDPAAGVLLERRARLLAVAAVVGLAQPLPLRAPRLVERAERLGAVLAAGP